MQDAEASGSEWGTEDGEDAGSASDFEPEEDAGDLEGDAGDLAEDEVDAAEGSGGQWEDAEELMHYAESADGGEEEESYEEEVEDDGEDVQEPLAAPSNLKVPILYIQASYITHQCSTVMMHQEYSCMWKEGGALSTSINKIASATCVHGNEAVMQSAQRTRKAACMRAGGVGGGDSARAGGQQEAAGAPGGRAGGGGRRHLAQRRDAGQADLQQRGLPARRALPRHARCAALLLTYFAFHGRAVLPMQGVLLAGLLL